VRAKELHERPDGDVHNRHFLRVERALVRIRRLRLCPLAGVCDRPSTRVHGRADGGPYAPIFGFVRDVHWISTATLSVRTASCIRPRLFARNAMTSDSERMRSTVVRTLESGGSSICTCI
jgi:hypothetical protein